MKRRQKKLVPCVACGAAMRISRGDFQFTITPRWSVTVADSELHNCPKCGRREGSVVKATALERKIAAEVLSKPAPLAPDEVKFLVECFDWTKREVANRLGVAPETLSRYEQGAYRLNPTVDRLLRMLVAALYLHDDQATASAGAQKLTGEAGTPLNLVLYLDGRGKYQTRAGHQPAHGQAA